MHPENTVENPLGTRPVGQLLRQFAIPSIIAMLVGALYNIVDQIFIGHAIGQLGNAATNVAFPITQLCTAISLLFGIGAAAAFNLSMGRGETEKAPHFIGNALLLLFLCGAVLGVVTLAFREPILKFCGSPEDVLPYAREYLSITAIGFPFLIFTTGGVHLVRADGSPRFSMACNLAGAILNTILDPILIFGFDMGMKGAAIATVLGQIVSSVLVFFYLRRFRTCRLGRQHLRVRWQYAGYEMRLGLAQCCNQLAMMVVQIVLNNSLKFYGAQSVYGEAIPLACAGIIGKTSFIFFSLCVGIAQGMQPIASFNYGARQYSRVKKVIRLALVSGQIICTVAFLMFQIFPRQIISIFGDGSSELYYQFAVRYFRIYLAATLINNIQPMSSTFFAAIGSPGKGTFLALTRQIIFLLPLIVTLPLVFGIDGIMYAGPVADVLAAVISSVLLTKELRKMPAVDG